MPQEYRFLCPYCFNKANGGTGYPIKDDEVAFSAETFFRSVRDIETNLGFTQEEIEMLPAYERTEKQRQFDQSKRFLLNQGGTERYAKFWTDYVKPDKRGEDDTGFRNNSPENLPVIYINDGIKEIRRDEDGFVAGAIDLFDRLTNRRVCPFCNNPLPKGYGKHPVKFISIIGVIGAGKTVYISQLLKNLFDYASKVGSTAYVLSSNELDFIKNNQVERNVDLPDSTTQNTLSPPMYYDIVRRKGTQRYTDTIVLYDIAGEDCTKVDAGERDENRNNFKEFIQHSDGLIILFDPKQLNLIVTDERDDDPKKQLSTLFSAIHSMISGKEGGASSVPAAVCISKSDECMSILPPEAREVVKPAGKDSSGFNRCEFNAASYNKLISGDRGLCKMLEDRLPPGAWQALSTQFDTYNFFAVSAIGCPVAKGKNGKYQPVGDPNPRRIEEPVLWLFKHFGFIGRNEKTLRPFKKEHAKRYIKRGLGPWTRYEVQPDEFSEFEEDAVRLTPQIQRGRNGDWEDLTPEEMANIEARSGK